MCAFTKNVSVRLHLLAMTEEQNIIYPPTLNDRTRDKTDETTTTRHRTIGIQNCDPWRKKKQGEPYNYPSLLHGEISSLWGREEEPIQNPEPVLPLQRHRDQHLDRPRHLEFVGQSTVEEVVWKGTLEVCRRVLLHLLLILHIQKRKILEAGHKKLLERKRNY